MARLLQWPAGLGISNFTRLRSARSIGSGGGEAISGFIQTVSSNFGLVSFKITLQKMWESKERRFRGLFTAFHGGANAVRYKLIDGAELTQDDLGIVGDWTGQPWSNGECWSNGLNWGKSKPVIQVGGAASKDDTFVTLSNSFWGHSLDIGDYIGFFPFHFGIYEITESLGNGVYRIFPPLRVAISTTDYCTLDPTMAVTITGEQGGEYSQDISVAEGSLTLREVPDDYIRANMDG